MIDQPPVTPANPADLIRAREPASRDIVDGRYVLEKRLGGGGMGVVYRARDQLMERHRDRDPYVALKLIHESMRNHSEARTLLQRECSRAQKLSHPNIIRVFYFGSDRETDTDYLTMELLLGEPLDRVIRDHAAGLEWNRASRVIDQLCSGLEFAHAQGIVHSDIKPSNLFLTESAVLKILDFGIAAPLRRTDTSTSETLLNPRHMGAVCERYSSLEMHLGMDADPSDDVYSAACVIYELLTGRHPFPSLKTPQAAERNIKPAAVPSLTKVQNRALRKALGFLREDRTATIAELKKGLLQSPRTVSRPRVWYAAAAVVTALAVGSVWLPRLRNPVAADAGSRGEIAQPGPDALEKVTPPASSPEPPASDLQFSPAGKPAPAKAVPVAASAGSPGDLAGTTSRSVESPPSAQPAASKRVAVSVPATKSAPAVTKKRLGKRCSSIEERIQLGETTSEEEQAYFMQYCR